MLNIQKVVLLLSEEHYLKFEKFLELNGNTLSLKLIQCIQSYGFEQPDSGELCAAIYQKSDEKTKRKFFQLAHHTFKLTSFLARNFPFYLVHNLSRISGLINDGKIKEGNNCADILVDISEKVEDWTTQHGVLKFLSHQAFVMEHQKRTLHLHQTIEKVLQWERKANELYTYLREHLNFKDRNSLTNPDIESHISFFRQYTNHESFSIRLISKYCIYHTMNYLDDKMFYDRAVLKGINDLRKELEKHSYMIVHFADDIPLKLDYMYLKHALMTEDKEKVLKDSMALIKKWQYLQFWKGYVNTTQIVSLSIQTSYYLTKYCYGYRTSEERDRLIPEEVLEKVGYLKRVCEELLEKPNWESGYFVRFINLNNIYCSLLLMGDDNDARKAIKILEGLLINYQQISFQKLYDSIFATLVIAYFNLSDFEGLQDTYKRYEKLTSNQVKIEENDLTTKAFYYTGQWRSTGRKQYIEKLKQVYTFTSEGENLNSTRHLIGELIEYYEIPIAAADLV